MYRGAGGTFYAGYSATWRNVDGEEKLMAIDVCIRDVCSSSYEDRTDVD